MKRYVKLPASEITAIDFTESWSVSPVLSVRLNQESIKDVVWSKDGLTGTISYDTLDITEPKTISYISPETGMVEQYTYEAGIYGRPLFYDATTMTEITEQEVFDLIAEYPVWTVGETFALENGILPEYKRRYNGKLYLVVQPHTSQADWTPDLVRSLYREIFPEEIIAPWKPYDGTASTIYQVGNRVTHNGYLWECNTPNCVWEPGVYGWSDLGPV